MATNRIDLQHVLTPEEYQALDTFGNEHPGIDALPDLQAFLAETFDIELVMDPDIVEGFRQDSSNLPGEAQALCRPRSERECAIALRACFAAGVPVTLSAGRSNLTGSATPQSGVILSTVAMTEPAIQIDAEAMTVKAPVGMILEELRNEILQKSDKTLLFPVDPTSRTDAAVGGAIACNASGFTPGEIGAIRHWVDHIDFLLPDGRKIAATRGDYVSSDGAFLLLDDEQETLLPVPRYARPPIKNAGGPYSSPEGTMDFVDLVVGSEGLLGLVTGCTLRLQTRPSDYLDLFFSLPTEKNAVAFYRYINDRLSGDLGQLSALEFFGVNCRKYMDHEERLFHGDDQVAVYVQVPLDDKSLEDAAEEWLEILIEADCGVNEDGILLMDNDRDRKVFIEARHSLPANSLEVVQHRGTFTIMTDTVVPPEHFETFLEYTHGLIQSEGMDYLAFGHLGDCHLHFTILPEESQLERGAEIYSMIVAKSAELGGVYSGEHGTGKRKRNDFIRCYGQDGVDQVRACKAAVDPEFLLNRGNVIE